MFRSGFQCVYTSFTLHLFVFFIILHQQPLSTFPEKFVEKGFFLFFVLIFFFLVRNKGQFISEILHLLGFPVSFR